MSHKSIKKGNCCSKIRYVKIPVTFNPGGSSALACFNGPTVTSIAPPSFINFSTPISVTVIGTNLLNTSITAVYTALASPSATTGVISQTSPIVPTSSTASTLVFTLPAAPLVPLVGGIRLGSVAIVIRRLNSACPPAVISASYDPI